jgi:protein involved in polysaccharide export with SLBB domain
LGIYVEKIFPAEQPLPVNSPDFQSPRYPGQTITPRVGAPVFVDVEGQIRLPRLPPLRVTGLTLRQVDALIRSEYTKAGVFVENQGNIFVGLLKPRFYKVTVIREDVEGLHTIQKDRHVLTKRGSAQVLEMPAYENDVLHALVASGGLPGEDACNCLWVIRAQKPQAIDATAIQEHAVELLDPDAELPVDMEILQGWTEQYEPIQSLNAPCNVCRERIPLRVCPGEPLPFGPEAVVLHEGDVVYVPSRKTEFYYVGGYLPGGQIPLPRDYDLDILGAIAIANGSVAGPAGERIVAFHNGPGNIIPPSRALILRQMPGGGQVRIRVNLKTALHDHRERILIRPGDFIMVQYTPAELFGNVALNLVNLNYAIPNR